MHAPMLMSVRMRIGHGQCVHATVYARVADCVCIRYAVYYIRYVRMTVNGMPASMCVFVCAAAVAANSNRSVTASKPMRQSETDIVSV